MSPFVNYRKRSFTLPPGCKDLVDLLQPPRRQKGDNASVRWLPPKIREEHFHTAGLAQIGRYVSMLLDSSAQCFTLSITIPEAEFSLVLCRSRSENTAAFVLLTKDAEQERAIQVFFSQHGIKPLQNFPNCDAGAPGEARGLIYPLPLDAARTTSLTTRLLGKVYGLSDEAGLDFFYCEVKIVPNEQR